ncbi:Nickel uptake substrate-specific transmembrane region [Caulifigura coniformis]|uniref:Nickel uptake substrate-specific transmembrane region n=1 Tax=Caulifigura coniformis TaxID=2527983 RepID=A0A517SBA1_9PLAN|nr:carboxypeptidase-like regulatory domain-containing protein [Caulifigura coniformis]QDT53413.1 Nickel uptake substrate-specific transmembrane region [Caulifigura coniformis]
MRTAAQGSHRVRAWSLRPVIMLALVVVASPCRGELVPPALPDLSAATRAAQQAIDSPIDLQLKGPDLDAALRQLSRESSVSIRIDLGTLMARKVILSDPAPARLKAETLRAALQELLAPPTAMAGRPAPVSSHEGAIQIDGFRWGPSPRGGSFEQGRWLVNGQVLDEAGKPVPRAAVRLYCWAWVMFTSTDEAGRFTATLPANGKLEVEAWDEDGGRRGWIHVGHGLGIGVHQKAPKITLKPVRRATVHVTGADQQPVPGARVVLIGGGFPYDGSMTSAAGESLLEIPADLEVEAVIAWKHGAGLDYVGSREFGSTRGNAQPVLATDQPVRLQLSKQAPVQFRILDQFDRPAELSPLNPWVLNKEGQGGSFNLTHLHAREMQFTDQEGFVTFDWLPAWQKDKVNFSGWGRQYSFADAELTVQEASSKLQTIRVERKTIVRGRVFDIEGQPARDVFVISRGGGFNKKSDYCNGVADHEGRFELAVPVGQAYLFVALSRNGKQVSAAEERVIESFEVPANDIDLYLRPAIRVFGKFPPRAEWLEKEKPVLRLVGDDLNARRDVNLPGDGSITPVRAVDEIQLDLKPDGAFSVLVGPGRYELAPTKDAPGIPFELIEQTEYEVPVPPL